MTSDEIEAAYAPTVASLRAGGHSRPDQGWPTEIIAAHLVANNDLIAETAERIAAGERIGYDNAAVVDDRELATLVDKAGDLAGLADELERSAKRLAAAGELLSEAGATQIHVIIHSDGAVVADREMAIGDLVVGNATFHLDSHREQIRELEPARLSEPPNGFDTYELVLLHDIEPAEAPTKEESDALLRQHLGHFTHMYEAGWLKVAGPLRDQPAGSDLAGICIYQTGSLAKARKLAEDDPAVRAGALRVELVTWYTAKDALSFDHPASRGTA
ncbi:MAG TPA: YciI family protein [Acidimicrobiales bacterium]|nr:YciI family protein [Acidimicrobiales bacterium]